MFTMFVEQMIDKYTINQKNIYLKVKIKTKRKRNKTFCFTRNEKRRGKIDGI